MLPEDKYCPACATPLEIKNVFGTDRPACPNCSHVVYHDPKVAATCIVEREGRILMIRRALQPGMGLWCMPGGYVNRGEAVEEAAAREVLEETGLVVEVEHLVGLFSEKGHPVIVAAFAATETSGALRAGPEAQEVCFFLQEALPPLAFPRDVEILERWRDLLNGLK